MSSYSAERFDSKELASFRQQLEARKKSLLQLEEANEEAAFGDSGSSGEISRVRLHPADLATDDQMQDTSLELAEHELREIQDVEAALDRLSKGSYGECTGCDEDIGVKRLQAFPEAALCLDCQTEQEQAAKVRQKPNQSEQNPSFKPLFRSQVD